MNFLDTLVAQNRLAFYFDFRTGSMRDLMGAVGAPTVAGNPAMKVKANERVARFASGSSLTYPYNAAFDSTGDMTLAFYTPKQYTAGAGISGSFWQSSEYNIQFLATPATQFIGKTPGVVFKLKPLTMDVQDTVAFTHSAGGLVEVFENGLSIGTVAGGFTLASTGANTVIGLYPIFLGAALKLDEILSDADIARLHRDLLRGPSSIAQAKRHFSIPKPVKTPAEYAADGCWIDLDLTSAKDGQIVNLADASEPFDIVKTGAGENVDFVPYIGPFDGAIKLRQATLARFENTNLGNDLVRRGTYTAWVDRYGANGPQMLRVDDSLLTHNNPQFFFYPDVSGGGAYRYDGASYLYGKWYHFKVVAPEITEDDAVLYVDGVPVVWDLNTATRSPIINANGLAYYPRYTGSVGFDGYTAQVKYQTELQTAGQVWDEYMLGARKLLVDARLHRDGSVPVMPVTLTSGDIPGTGWTIGSAGFKVIEDAPSGGVPGARWIQVANTSAIHLYRREGRDMQAYGSWYFKGYQKQVTDRLRLCFISDTAGPTALASGYYLYISLSGQFRLAKLAAGVTTWLFQHNVAFITQTEYEIWVSRRYDGQFTVWVRFPGATWEQVVPATAGTNPVTDTAHKTSDYMWIDSNSNVQNEQFGDMMHFLGCFPPWEA